MILTMPIVTVVIPMYNVERFIERSIRSVLNQTFEQFEIICVDDGCTDGTLARLANFDDPRIRLVRQQNRGLSGARNTGINHARGRYVALLDADDFWGPDKLRLHVKHLNENPAVGVSYCPSKFVTEAGQELGIGQYPKLMKVTAKDVFCRNPVGNGSAAVIRLSLLAQLCRPQKIDGVLRHTYFDESMRQSEDIEFWMRAALNTQWAFEGIPQAMTYYCVNTGGLSANLRNQYDSWLYAVNKHQSEHPSFFRRYGNLAKAYQLRYLARRAIQSGNRGDAFRMLRKALKTQPSILVEEPARTLATMVCAVLRLLPDSMYQGVQQLAFAVANQQRKMTAG